MPKRIPLPVARPEPSLLHDRDRERGQPYATEVEDYSHGVAPSPTEQGGREVNSRTTRGRKKK
jgi:hypothetical protein